MYVVPTFVKYWLRNEEGLWCPSLSPPITQTNVAVAEKKGFVREEACTHSTFLSLS